MELYNQIKKDLAYILLLVGILWGIASIPEGGIDIQDSKPKVIKYHKDFNMSASYMKYARDYNSSIGG